MAHQRVFCIRPATNTDENKEVQTNSSSFFIGVPEQRPQASSSMLLGGFAYFQNGTDKSHVKSTMPPVLSGSSSESDDLTTAEGSFGDGL